MNYYPYFAMSEVKSGMLTSRLSCLGETSPKLLEPNPETNFPFPGKVPGGFIS